MKIDISSIDQSGNGNAGTVNQYGVGDFSTLTQAGNGNIATSRLCL